MPRKASYLFKLFAALAYNYSLMTLLLAVNCGKNFICSVRAVFHFLDFNRYAVRNLAVLKPQRLFADIFRYNLSFGLVGNCIVGEELRSVGQNIAEF